MPATLDFDLHFGRGPDPQRVRRSDDDPMRILLVGDFSGSAALGAAPPTSLAQRPLLYVDVDNFDTVLRRCEPRFELRLQDGGELISFSELEDFHPDSLYERVALFRSLREQRSRLADPSTFEAAAAELLRDAPHAAPQVSARPESEVRDEEEGEASLLDRLLGSAPANQPRQQAKSAVDGLIREIVRPYLTPDISDRQQMLVSSVDTAIGELMRRLLHQPAFQGLEARWRAVDWLITELETGEELKIYLLNMTMDEARSDLASGALEDSQLYRRLVDQGAGTAGGQPWSLVVSDWYCGATVDDIALLARLGALAARAGGPLLTGLDMALLGCSSIAETPDAGDWGEPEAQAAAAWEQLRAAAVAPWIGVAAPRLLLRRPYGKGSDEIDRFDFVELGDGAPHESLLWANPAFGCARLIAEGFSREGWRAAPGTCQQLTDLPQFVMDVGGESRLQPCAEALISERTAEAMLEAGVMPMVSYRDRNAVSVLRMQSVARPPRALAGPWD